MPKPALCISDKMLMSFNGWNPELLNMNHGQNIVSIMSRFTCKKKFVFFLIYYNDKLTIHYALLTFVGYMKM